VVFMKTRGGVYWKEDAGGCKALNPVGMEF